MTRASIERRRMVADDMDRVRQLDGLYVGMLTDEERELFNHAISEGIAYRSYEGVGGQMLGMPKVRIF